MEKICKVSEIFESIQGEGLYVGQKHLFVRLFGCNSDCKYCDTKLNEADTEEYSYEKLFNEISSYSADTVSFTGGEPLLWSNFLAGFLEEYKQTMKKKIYLETNGTLPFKLREVIDFVDIVAMDFKLESATGLKNDYARNDEFLLVARDKEVFAKVVYDKNITDREIQEVANLALRHGICVVMQPKMPMDVVFDPLEAFLKLHSYYKNVRLIPQMHKIMDWR